MFSRAEVTIITYLLGQICVGRRKSNLTQLHLSALPQLECSCVNRWVLYLTSMLPNVNDIPFPILISYEFGYCAFVPLNLIIA